MTMNAHIHFDSGWWSICRGECQNPKPRLHSVALPSLWCHINARHDRSPTAMHERRRGCSSVKQNRIKNVKHTMSTKFSCKDHPDLQVDTAHEYVSHFNLYHDRVTGASNQPWPEPFEAPNPTDADYSPFTHDLGEMPL